MSETFLFYVQLTKNSKQIQSIELPYRLSTISYQIREHIILESQMQRYLELIFQRVLKKFI